MNATVPNIQGKDLNSKSQDAISRKRIQFNIIKANTQRIQFYFIGSNMQGKELSSIHRGQYSKERIQFNIIVAISRGKNSVQHHKSQYPENSILYHREQYVGEIIQFLQIHFLAYFLKNPWIFSQIILVRICYRTTGRKYCTIKNNYLDLIENSFMR